MGYVALEKSGVNVSIFINESNICGRLHGIFYYKPSIDVGLGMHCSALYRIIK